MKKCELCKSTARMYCDSDRATLCWDCDTRVHTANFLVAKHTRTLLCHVCQCLTPWTGSGSKLGQTVSVCESCVDRVDRNGNSHVHSENGDAEEDEDDEEQLDESEDEVEEEDDSDNQVVPFSSISPTQPSATSSSSRWHNLKDRHGPTRNETIFCEESSSRYSRGSDGLSDPYTGYLTPGRADQNSSFSYNDNEKDQERIGEITSSWRWH